MANKKNNKKKKKNTSRSTDNKSLILIATGLILAFIVYTEGLGFFGEFIKKTILGGLLGKLAFVLPFILIIYGIYIVFKDYVRLKMKGLPIIIFTVLLASLITSFDDYPINPENYEGYFSSVGKLTALGTEFVGGGLLGAIITVPLAQGFSLFVARGIIIILLIAISFVIGAISISSIIQGIASFGKKTVHKGKEKIMQIAEDVASGDDEEEELEEYEEELEQEELEEIEEELPKKKKNKKFAQIMEQTEIIGSGRQISFKDLTDDLDIDETPLDEEEEVEEEVIEKEPEEKAQVPVKETKRVMVRDIPKDSQKASNIANQQKDLYTAKTQTKEDNKPLELNLTHSEVENYDDYEFPPIGLLKEPELFNEEYSVKELRDVAAKLQHTLSSFNVDAKVVNVTRGPTVTQYEVQPNVGVKVSKILSLSDDIALNLAAKSIRIEAPIPGKSAVGIEVPNQSKETVWLREVIESDAFKDAKSKVSFALGKSIDGEPFVSDIAKMPHLLIAGSTGSGKSVCINSILVSLLYKAKPNEVKLILIDPKVVELGIYNGIPHLLIPVVTDPRKAAGALNWAVQEMVNRYNLFASKGVRDIRGYNDLLTQEGEDGILPQIVIIVDELADLMMVAPSEVEDAICRLAQMARAAGMHLIIATQRPSVDVVTGIIKANIPSRIAFTVSSQIDSRTILDMGGAEKLLGKGDMLYFPIGESKPVRVQGTFVTDKEIENIIDFVKSNATANYDINILESFEENNKSPQTKADEAENDYDEFLFDAIELAVQMGNASASMIQRKFKVGYARAGRIIDQMEDRGIISGYEGSKPRKTLISKEEWEEMKEAGVENVRFEDVSEEDLVDNTIEEETEYYEDASDSEEEYDDSSEDVYEEETEEYEESDEEQEDTSYEEDEATEEESEEDEQADSEEDSSDDDTSYDYDSEEEKKYTYD